MSFTSRVAAVAAVSLLASMGVNQAQAQFRDGRGDGAGRVGSSFGGSRQIVVDGNRPAFTPQAPRPQGAANRFSPQVGASLPTPRPGPGPLAGARISPQVPFQGVSPQVEPPRVFSIPQAPPSIGSPAPRFSPQAPSFSPQAPVGTRISPTFPVGAAGVPGTGAVASVVDREPPLLGLAPSPAFSAPAPFVQPPRARELQPPAPPSIAGRPETAGPQAAEQAEVEPRVQRTITVEPVLPLRPRARIIGTYRDGDGQLLFLREGDTANLRAATLWGVASGPAYDRPAPFRYRDHGGGHHRPAPRHPYR